jgi:predicted patatin/cPLA2 family phospholipase
MPVIAGNPYMHEQRLLLDASLSEPIPIVSAELDHHTHALVLLTRGVAMRPHVSAFDRYFVSPRLRRVSPRLAEQYLTRAVPYSEIVRTIDAGAGPLGYTRVLGIRVDDMHISKLETRRDVLREGSRRGYQAVRNIFGMDSPPHR